MFSMAATIDWLNRRRENVGNLARWPFYVLLAAKIAKDCKRLQWIGPDSGNQESGNSCRPWKHLDLLPQLQAICANYALYDNRKSFH